MAEAKKPAPSEISKKRWKYIGYRGFCDVIASENDFLIVRRFNSLAVRILLMLQDEIVELEDQLQELETRLIDPDGIDVHNGSFRQETQENRLELMREINQKLIAYHQFANLYSSIHSRPRVPEKDIKSVANWFENHPGAILPEETEYVSHRRDLFSLVPRHAAPLRQLIDSHPALRRLSLWRKRTTDEGLINYYSERKIEGFISIVITLAGLFMLICPLWILAFVEDMEKRLVVITAFVVLFLPLVTFTSTSRPFEVLAATAGYAAVLAVFLQIGQ